MIRTPRRRHAAHSRLVHALALLLLIPTAVGARGPSGTADGEEAFSEMPLEEAIEATRQGERILLVDFMAEWCGPCKKMERDTWAHEEVLGWLETNAIALQVDVDEEQALAKTYGVRAMPTVVALVRGEEFARFTGYRDATSFLAWCRDVRAGKRPVDVSEKRPAMQVDESEYDERAALARELLFQGQYAEALEHYLWMWPASRDVVGQGGVRLSFMLVDIDRLMRNHAPAKEAFLAILDELGQRVHEGDVPRFQDWQEWTAMCENFGQQARIVGWYERKRDDTGALRLERAPGRLRELITKDVLAALIRLERHRDAVRLVGDARAFAKNVLDQHLELQAMIAAFEDETDDTQELGFAYNPHSLVAGSIGQLYGALLVCGEVQQAQGVAEVLIEALDLPCSRTSLVHAALTMTGQARDEFDRWLDEAEAAGARVRSLRRRLEQARR